MVNFKLSKGTNKVMFGRTLWSQLIGLLALFAVLNCEIGTVTVDACDPVEEGREASLTCTVSTASCFPSIVLRWYADSAYTARHNATVVCYKDHCNSTYYNSSLSTSISGTKSVLTINSVSRTSPFDMETRWTCFGTCSSKETTACDYLMIYAKPEGQKCTMRESITSGDIKLVTVSCETTKVYPAANCSIERITNGGNPVVLSQTIAYRHSKTENVLADYYRSECSVTVPVKDLGEGTHTFQVYIYPDVTGGRNLVNATAVPGNVSVLPPQDSQECPPQMTESHFNGSLLANCNCSHLESDGQPQGPPEPGLNFTFNSMSNDIEEAYFCKDVSDRSSESTVAAKFVNGSAVSLSLASASPEFSEGDTPTITCTLRGSSSRSLSLVKQGTRDEQLASGQETIAITHTLGPLKCLDTGVYVCTGLRNGETVKAEISIGVKCSQKLSSIVDAAVNGKVGGDVKIYLEVYGYPEPRMITLMRTTDRTNQTGSLRHTLHYFPSQPPFGLVRVMISDLVAEDFANYTLLVENGVADAMLYDFYLNEDSPLKVQDDTDFFGEDLAVKSFGVAAAVAVIVGLLVIVIILFKKMKNLKSEFKNPKTQQRSIATETETSDSCTTSDGYLIPMDSGSSSVVAFSHVDLEAEPHQYLSIGEMGQVNSAYDNNSQ